MRKSIRSVSFTLVFLILSLPAGAVKYQERAVSNGGTITGKVIYNGAVKIRTVLSTEDKQVRGSSRYETISDLKVLS